ncbi:MASE1 domain-containing protein [Thalassobius sp. I31.1]|uniref:sensor histidine kinase n=1 Tax=Thalassobius sp. I31.1 TaxID=2109912 RepID=UPI001300BEDF|nr:MASE1 domain-containing protein [Thalassobius sp. I31.1]
MAKYLLLIFANNLDQFLHMRKIFDFSRRDALLFVGLIVLWLAAYKSADVFNFFETYSSLWFLPAGVTLSIALVMPHRMIFAPLVANLLLAIPIVCNLLDIEFTGCRDPILHSFRLFIVYAGAGLLIRHLFGVTQPIETLRDELILLLITIGAALVGAFTGVSLHAVVGNFSWVVAWDILLPWAVGDAIGALIVPPLLVPFLFWLNHPKPTKLEIPNWRVIAFQLITILLAMFVAFSASQQSVNMGPLWYVILLPPIVFAVCGGLPAAARATALTTLLTPPAAYLFGFEGERTALQCLLLVSAGISLMIGAAITDRQRAFAAVKESEEQLEQQVRDRTQQLQEAYEFQQHLIKSIGHDLRQPVQSIDMMLEGLVREHKATPSVRRLEQALNVSKTAGGFITRVLEYAKRDAGKVVLQSEDFPIQRVFDQLSQTFQPQADVEGIILEIQQTDLRLTSDAHLLWEALSNLLQNAVRLSNAGETVTVAAAAIDGFVTIIVTDQIQTVSNPVGQAGFGLEIVQQIARLLEGEFQLEANQAIMTLPA